MSETLMQRASRLLREDQSWFSMWRGRRSEIRREVARAIAATASFDLNSPSYQDYPARFSHLLRGLTAKLLGYHVTQGGRCIRYDYSRSALLVHGDKGHPSAPVSLTLTSHVMVPEPWDEAIYEAQVVHDLVTLAEALQARCKACPMELQCLVAKEEAE